MTGGSREREMGMRATHGALAARGFAFFPRQRGAAAGGVRIEPLEPRRFLSNFVVSPTGNDANVGAASAPWATLQRAADGVRPGDVVTVLAGRYAGFQMRSGGAAGMPVVFDAQHGAVIDSRNAFTPDGVNLEGASYVTLRGFDVEGMPRAGIRSVTNTGVVIANNRINGSGWWGVLTGFSENVDIESNAIGGSARQHGIYVSNSADNPVIRGNRVWDNRQSGIQINADASMGGDGIITGAVVEGNVVFSNGDGGGAAINLDGVQQSLVRNNLLYDNHSTGLALYQTDGAAGPRRDVVVNNTIVMAADARWAVSLSGGGPGNVFLNNVVVTAHPWRGGLSVSQESVAGLRSDFNAWPDRFTTDAGDSVLTLKQWRAATGNDAHSFVGDEAELFAGAASADFHLAGDSPAVEAGTQAGSGEFDLDGAARSAGKGVDDGAFASKARLTALGLSRRRDHGTGGRMPRRKALALAAVAGVALGGFAWAWRKARQRGLDRWLPSYVRSRGKRRAPAPGEEVHVLLCIADHFEPRNGAPPREVALGRVGRWVRDYPGKLGAFRDSDGRPPRHTFFYPLEQYDADEMDRLAELCRAGFGEVEVHLHHDHDTAHNLRLRLLKYKEMLASRHGLLPRDKSGGVRYGFVHGNWALDNSRPDGRWCGVNNELDVLRETGCYADFTLPSAPSPTQTRKINSVYYAVDDPARPRSHEDGVDAGRGAVPENALLLVQGPLLLNWRRRKWGVLPRVENACLQANQVPTLARLDLWLRARVQVPARPDWRLVKLHTHGAPEGNAGMLLGAPMARFHAALAGRAAADRRFHYHYVTAREMYNLVKAAETGWRGTVAGALDFELTWNARVGEVVEGKEASSVQREAVL